MTIDQVLALMRLIADQELQITALQAECAHLRAELEQRPPAPTGEGS